MNYSIVLHALRVVLVAVSLLALKPESSFAGGGTCSKAVSLTFSADGTSATAQCAKNLTTVVLKFCDGSANKTFTNLSGSSLTFSAGNKKISGAWVKTSCHTSGDGEYFSRPCTSSSPSPTCTPKPTRTPYCTHTPTATKTPTPSHSKTPTPTATPTPTPTLTKICHIPNGVSSSAYTMTVPQNEVQAHLNHGDSLGECPLDCMGVPFGQAVIDQCGICGGDSSTCVDCSGAPNGTKVLDACNVCGGDNSTCAGCDGVANSGKVIDACGLCGGDNSSCKDCNGVPNGGAVIDQCGVCGGNDSTCRDCAGTINGTAKIDSCGVCGGNDECENTQTCTGKVDQCGVCNGTNGCLDCAGIPNGGTLVDCCGICGGDGTSCPDKCKIYDLTKAKRTSSQNIKKLYVSIEKYSKQEIKCRQKGAQKEKAKARIILAKKVTAQSTELLNTYFADKVKLCNTEFCVKTNLASVLSTVSKNTKQLYNLSRNSQYAAEAACGTGRNKQASPRVAKSVLNSLTVSLKGFPEAACNN